MGGRSGCLGLSGNRGLWQTLADDGSAYLVDGRHHFRLSRAESSRGGVPAAQGCGPPGRAPAISLDGPEGARAYLPCSLAYLLCRLIERACRAIGYQGSLSHLLELLGSIRLALLVEPSGTRGGRPRCTWVLEESPAEAQRLFTHLVPAKAPFVYTYSPSTTSG